MIELSSISELPNSPSVYAMYGGHKGGLYVAYVGMAGKLKQRIMQHLIRRDSSVSTGTSAVVLNPDYVSEVRWWEHPDFVKRHILEAAELVAFDVLDPALRSRGAIQEQSKAVYTDEDFQEKMRALFLGSPTGLLAIPTLQDALARITELEQRIVTLEQQLPKNK